MAVDQQLLTEEITPTESNGRASTIKWWQTCLPAFLCVLTVEALCFGPIIKKIGFYLDDWVMLYDLEFAPKPIFLAMAQFFHEPRVIVRPVEVPYFVILHNLFDKNPFGYHLANGAMEVMNGFLFFLILQNLTGSRALSLASALVFLLYPNHDVTHYWLFSSPVTFSLMLFLASWLSAVQWSKSGKLALLISSVVLFTLSLLNYETFLPLGALIAATPFLMGNRDEKLSLNSANLRATFKVSSLLAVGTVLFVIYYRFIAPSLGDAIKHPVDFSCIKILDTMWKGVLLNLPPQASAFFLEQADWAVKLGAPKHSIFLILLTVVSLLAVGFMAWQDKQDPKTARISPLALALLGAFTVALSYSIFGLNDEYRPTYTSIVNRINAGASIGLAMVICAVLQTLAAFFSPKNNVAGIGKTVAVSSLAIALCVFFTVVNWGLSRCFTQSWSVQSMIFENLQKNKAAFSTNNCYILSDCPRYLFWSPVMDGVWDFGSMLRVATGMPKLQGDVVSDRMKFTKSEMRDVSMNYLCATYPFSKMYMVVAPHCQLVPVGDAETFMRLLKEHGTRFEPDSHILSRWQQEMDKALNSANK